MVELKMAPIDFSYLNRLSLSMSTERAPTFQIKIRGWVQSQKLKKLNFYLQDQLVMTSVVSFSKGQPCLTSSVENVQNLAVELLQSWNQTLAFLRYIHVLCSMSGVRVQ